jgi:hypothetical protein
MNDPLQWVSISSHFGSKDELFWSNGAKVSYLRAFLNFGGPLKNMDIVYTDKEDRKQE